MVICKYSPSPTLEPAISAQALVPIFIDIRYLHKTDIYIKRYLHESDIYKRDKYKIKREKYLKFRRLGRSTRIGGEF